MSSSKKNRLLEFALVFAVTYLAVQLITRFFFPGMAGQQQEGGRPDVLLRMADSSVRSGHAPVVVITNNTDEPLTLPDRCPMPPVEVYRVLAPNTEREKLEKQATEQTALPCRYKTTVPPNGGERTIDLKPWKYALFGEFGTYELRLPERGGTEGTEVEPVEESRVARFSMHEANWFIELFRTIISAPLLNALIFLASVLPNHSLGWSIVILTMVIKLILFFPTQRAMESQRRMQKLQPKLEALKKKYKNNQQKLQQETMKLWKQEKVNPFGACLPMLLQFPILIGLFFVIRDGVVLEVTQHLVYPMYQELSWSFGTQFLGLDLTQPNWTVLPVLLAVLQFGQMKLSFAKQKQGSGNKQEVIDVGDKKKEKKQKKEKKEQASPQQMQQQMMLYGLPLMIGFFATQFPAAVALYWGASTVFAIGQQVIVNRVTDSR